PKLQSSTNPKIFFLSTIVAITFIEPIKEKPASSRLKILKAEEIEPLKEMVALGGDALADTERY
ncbi:MAG: hypothetical protein QME81_19095, partial [bacterium]|nr:hypothetical protein [bacterium]